jgi:hypothetical protein
VTNRDGEVCWITGSLTPLLGLFISPSRDGRRECEKDWSTAVTGAMFRCIVCDNRSSCPSKVNCKKSVIIKEKRAQKLSERHTVASTVISQLSEPAGGVPDSIPLFHESHEGRDPSGELYSMGIVGRLWPRLSDGPCGNQTRGVQDQLIPI